MCKLFYIFLHCIFILCLLSIQYAAKEFGTCPLQQCQGQPVLPVGLKDEMGADTVKIFCPKCQCVYHPPPIRSRSSSHHGAGPAGVDGAAFGTTFPHLFLMTFSNLVPDPLPPNSAYIPRVFGFRVHMSARQRAPAAAVEAANATAAAYAALNKKDKSRLGMTRKTSSVGSGGGKNDVKANEEDQDAKSSSAKSSSLVAAPAAGLPKIESATANNTAGNEKTKSGSKRRPDGTDGNPKNPEGNGVLLDNNAAKKRKTRSDNATG